MSKREVCLLIGKGGAVLWSDASDSPVALPDSRARWEAIWNLRDELEVIAHSHPVGPAAFSAEDTSTMEALDSALGKSMRYMVVAPTKTIAREGTSNTEDVVPEPWWAALLRLASGMTKQIDSETRANEARKERAAETSTRGKDE
jgi:hypothetical protein